MVENVEGFCTEFEADPLCDRKVFEQGHVEVRAARVFECVSAKVSKG